MPLLGVREGTVKFYENSCAYRQAPAKSNYAGLPCLLRARKELDAVAPYGSAEVPQPLMRVDVRFSSTG